MSELVRRLHERRMQAWRSAKAILDRADGERRDLTTAEEAEFDAHKELVEALDARMQELIEKERRAKETQETFAKILGQEPGARNMTATDTMLAAEFRDRIARNSREPITVEWRDARSGFQPGIERRSITTGTGGGLTGTTFFNRLVMHLTEMSAILAAGATVVTTETGEDLVIPASTALSTASIVPEGAQIPMSDPGVAPVTLRSYKYGFLVQVSGELANDTAFDLLDFLAREAAQALANGAGAHFIAGTGSGQPSGVLTAATVGVTGAGPAPTADELIDLYHSVAEPYARSQAAGWLMSNATLAAVRKLKDNQGRYLFDVDIPPGTGAAGTLLGRPVFVDPNMPTVAPGAKSILFGDWSRYVVRSVREMRFERSDDFAFDRDMVTFRALWRVDGALVDTTGAIKSFIGGGA
ncbi:phage major capsid protein [Thermomonospora catenispora]|uniref:phage major capsid protein n=1 Tax=Thermomonospora catenispora TaxID=2493090 RepID=UPI00111CC662|nr:phage major capsid protein [Thermomonospora catenispora]TNY38695.1 phage major capsid protein [Thermomonospora catenispora]